MAAVGQHGMLAGDLRHPVDVEGGRAILLDVGRALRAVEDVVGADVDEPRPELGTRAREVQRRDGVHGERHIGRRFALRHVVERRGVDHDVGPETFEGGADGVRVGDVEVVVAEADHVVRREGLDTVASELAGCAKDDGADQKTPPIALIVFSIVLSSVIHSML